MHLIRIPDNATPDQLAEAIGILRQRAKAARGDERVALDAAVDELVGKIVEAQA